jgi:hypothetical protein
MNTLGLESALEKVSELTLRTPAGEVRETVTEVPEEGDSTGRRVRATDWPVNQPEEGKPRTSNSERVRRVRDLDDGCRN